MHKLKIKEGLRGKSFITLKDFTTEEIKYLLDFASKLKEETKKGIEHHHLKGKTLGMIFQKSSTRTRVSFEVGMYQLGGQGLFLSANDLQMGRGEPIKDTARVLSRYLNGIMIRTFDQKDVEDLRDFGSIPIINGLTDDTHPCQVLADLLTIKEKFGTFENKKLAYFGDGNNMAHSLIIGCAKMGIDVAIISPKKYSPKDKWVNFGLEIAKETGSKITITENIDEGIKDANIIYGDVWTSMGQEAESKIRLNDLKDYQINDELLNKAAKDAIVLHCLPAHRGEEITDSVLEGPKSVVFDEAENRLHAQKAILASLL